MKKRKAIILAAGEGSRMKSKKAKVLHEVLGKPMILRVLQTAQQAGLTEIAVITGHQAQQVEEALAGQDVVFFRQDQQLGTGHAVMQAEAFLEKDADILILYGDTPLMESRTIQRLLDQQEASGAAVTVVSAQVDDPTGYGRIVRDEAGKFARIVEHKDATAQQRQIQEINTGIYCFDGGALQQALGRIQNDNVQGEYYLPDALALILADGREVNVLQAEDAGEFLGINTRSQLADAQRALQRRINQRLMDEGVTILDPNSTFIGEEVQIGMDTIIRPQTHLEGKTVIGENCEIGPCCRLTDMIVGNQTQIQFTVAMESKIGDETKVGPYAYIRPNCVIGDHIKVGDFVEVKNSVIGNGTKISHLTYVGDSDVGERINFGCGTVTVNYDGKKKYRTTIEDDVFIGCNANLVAPVTLKQGSYVAAGSTITKDVPENALAVARTRQSNLEGWHKK